MWIHPFQSCKSRVLRARTVELLNLKSQAKLYFTFEGF